MISRGTLNEQDISALRLEMSIGRAESGLTYDALAKKSGVSRRTVISIETGTSRGSLDTWMRIYNALDRDFGSFLQELKRPMTPDNSRGSAPIADFHIARPPSNGERTRRAPN
jgi:putative transcriptional regulator